MPLFGVHRYLLRTGFRRTILKTPAFFAVFPSAESCRISSCTLIERADHAGFQHHHRRALAFVFNRFECGFVYRAPLVQKSSSCQLAEFRVRKFSLLHDRIHGQVLEEVTWHLVQFRLRRRGNDHSEIECIPLEFRLHRERLDLLGWVPGQECLLRWLLDVGVLGAEIAAGGTAGRRACQANRNGQARHAEV